MTRFAPSRRGFLQLAAGSLLAACSDPATPEGDDDGSALIHRRFDTSAPVIVLGAGISGLAAASTLARRGFSKIKVIEARNRLGGRIHTDRSTGTPFDLGAAWVHHATDSSNPLLGLVEGVGLRPAKTDWTKIGVYDAHEGLLAARTLKAGEDRFDSALVELRRKIDQLADSHVPLADVIGPLLASRFHGETDERLLNFLRGFYIENEYAADLRDLGAYGFAKADTDVEDDRLVGGYDKLIDSLAKGLDISLGEAVTRVRRDRDGVTVDTERGSYRAAAVIVTLPVAVLRAGAVEFAPGLPEAKQRAIRDIGVGDFEKVVMMFDQARWPTDVHAFGFAPENANAAHSSPLLLNVQSVAGAPAIVAMLSGAAAREASSMNDHALAERTLAQLRTMFGRDLPAPRAVLRTRWHDDPFARGAYCYPAIGDLDTAIKDLAAHVDGRIFFAGEATDKDWWSYAHGAYNSGVRVATNL